MLCVIPVPVQRCDVCVKRDQRGDVLNNGLAILVCATSSAMLLRPDQGCDINDVGDVSKAMRVMPVQ
jgi:hypothetical protein